MSVGWLGRTAILLLVGLVTVTPANAGGPDDTFKHNARAALEPRDQASRPRRNRAVYSLRRAPER